MLRDLAWRLVARFVTIPAVTDWLIARAQRTPYKHIYSQNGASLYMGRWWLFNPQPDDDEAARSAWRRLVPSARIHWIRRQDQDRHRHDHPRESRTIVLRNWYREERQAFIGDTRPTFHLRTRGYTGRLRVGDFHRICEVAPQGVWTLFLTWEKKEDWGFDVNGIKVPWRQYVGSAS